MLDPKKLMEMQKQMMQQMESLQAERELQEYEGSAGGGVVVCKVNGNNEVIDLIVKPEAVDPDDIELLQDLVVAAVNTAMKKAKEENEKAVGKLTGGMNLPSFLSGM